MVLQTPFYEKFSHKMESALKLLLYLQRETYEWIC